MKMNAATKSARAAKLIARVVAMSENDAGLRLHAQHLLDRMNLPMSAVLNKVPGGTVTERAALIGVTRQTYYGWLRGVSRPNTKQSKRLAELTGLKWQTINGTRLSPTRAEAAP
jgi:transcriptional regulator with XRE-family HTH domain